LHTGSKTGGDDRHVVRSLSDAHAPPPTDAFSLICRKRHLGDKLVEKAPFMMRT
jgi:hypothetical protein